MSAPFRNDVALLAALSLLALPLLVRPATADPQSCAPADHEHFICGVNNPEDLVQIRGTPWVAASGMVVGKTGRGHLYLIDSRSKAVTSVEIGATEPALDKKNYPDCPGPPADAVFNTHGLWYRPGTKGGTLYAVNHGGRESVEVFRVSTGQSSPHLTWIGCAVESDGHVYLDGVIGTPDGGVIATSLFDPSAKIDSAQLDTGTVKGRIIAWTSKTGWKDVPGGDLVTPNGIEIAPDGKHLFVAGWTSHSVIRLSLGATPVATDVIKVDFMPDNMRYAADGTLYAAGQGGTVTAGAPCFASDAVRCTSPWSAVTIDTKALTAHPVVHRDGGSYFGSATTALPIGRELWIGTYRGDRIAVLTEDDLVAR